MRRAIMLLLTLTLAATTAGAFDLGAHAPAKAPAGRTAPPPPDPEVIRQGGDTFVDAILLEIPVSGVVGTTQGYADDYDEVCPYDDSTAPDVVYKLVTPYDLAVDIDMYGSSYDTKIYVYDAQFTLVACNDDWYPDYVSRLENVHLDGDTKYYLVIDGYGSEAGEYTLDITVYEPCTLECPAGFEIEGEPPLGYGYVDEFNGGCNSPEYGDPFDTMWGYFCGRSGWYINDDGFDSRDTDWFELIVPASGFIEIIGDAEYETYMFELGPTDCDNVAVIQDVIIGPCMEGTITIPGTPGDTVWFWVGPTTFEGPVNEYTYVLMTNWYRDGTVARETASWSAIKGMFSSGE